MTMRRLLWIWALISVGWAILIITPHWPDPAAAPLRYRPILWELEHPECRDRLGFWPDGTRMDDDELSPFHDPEPPRRQLSDRERWAYDVRKKVADCEYAEWGPIVIRKQWQELLIAALLPPAILLLVGAATAFGWKHVGETIARYFPRVPRHIRRGLIRLYTLVSVPWVAWFYYVAYRHSQLGDWDEFGRTLLWLPVVPVGAPILCFIFLWIVGGFRKQAEDQPDRTVSAGPQREPERDVLSKSPTKEMSGKPVDRKPSETGYAIGSIFLALFLGWAATWVLDRFLFYTFLHRGIVPHIPSTIDELLGTHIPLLGGINLIKTVYLITGIIVFCWVMRWRGHWRPSSQQQQ